jgi:hypothetical protein
MTGMGAFLRDSSTVIEDSARDYSTPPDGPRPPVVTGQVSTGLLGRLAREDRRGKPAMSPSASENFNRLNREPKSPHPGMENRLTEVPSWKSFPAEGLTWKLAR